MFERFDICEAFNLLAHDYGLYDIKTRLDRLGFRCSPLRETYDGLSDNARDIYDSHVNGDRLTGIRSIYA